jgi:hypothetical protein
MEPMEQRFSANRYNLADSSAEFEDGGVLAVKRSCTSFPVHIVTKTNPSSRGQSYMEILFDKIK